MMKKRRQRRYFAGGRLKLRMSEPAMAAAERAFRRSRYFIRSGPNSVALNAKLCHYVDELAHLLGDDYVAASHWLSQPQERLQGSRPIDLLVGGKVAEIENVIDDLRKSVERDEVR
jgi:uncharacterized protein (DUF2384 family)